MSGCSDPFCVSRRSNLKVLIDKKKERTKHKMDTHTIIECHTWRDFENTPISAEHWCEAFSRVKFCKNTTSDELEAYTDITDDLEIVKNNADTHCFVSKKVTCASYLIMVCTVLKCQLVENRSIIIVMADKNMILIPGFYRSFYWKQFCIRCKMISYNNLQSHSNLLLSRLQSDNPISVNPNPIINIPLNYEQYKELTDNLQNKATAILQQLDATSDETNRAELLKEYDAIHVQLSTQLDEYVKQSHIVLNNV